jgi:hypothetical protein
VSRVTKQDAALVLGDLACLAVVVAALTYLVLAAGFAAVTPDVPGSTCRTDDECVAWLVALPGGVE